MAAMIAVPGEYVGRNEKKARVLNADDKYAFGYCDEIPCVWWSRTGAVLNYPGAPSLDITGPFVPPRKPVEGVWIWFDDCGFIVKLDHKPFEEGVKYRRVDPKAEQKAREILDRVRRLAHTPMSGAQICNSVERALSLLFPDAS